MGLPITGPHRLRVRMRRAGPDAAAVRVELRQGATVVASRVFTPGGAFQDYELVLSAAEVDRITDYADLRIRVSAFTAYSSSGSGSGSGGSGSGAGSVEIMACVGQTIAVANRVYATVLSSTCGHFTAAEVFPLDYVGLLATLDGTSHVWVGPGKASTAACCGAGKSYLALWITPGAGGVLYSLHISDSAGTAICDRGSNPSDSCPLPDPLLPRSGFVIGFGGGVCCNTAFGQSAHFEVSE